MANRKVRSPLHDVDDPTSAALVQLTDESDGTHSPVTRTRLEAWDGTGWIKVAADSNGNLQAITAATGTGNVNIASTAVTQAVSGTLTVQQAIASALQVTIGATTVTQPVSGSVSAAVTGTVALAGSSVPVAGATLATPVVILDASGNQITSFGSATVAITGTTLPVTDNGGSLTVDNTGTFAVQADTEMTTADLDTGAGTDTRAVVGLVGSKSGGAQLIPGDATAGLKVDLGADNDVTVTSGTVTTVSTVASVTALGTVTPGTAATSLGKAEDAAHASGDVGVMALAVRRASATDLSAGATDGDYEPLQVDASGRLHVLPAKSATATGSNVTASASSGQLLASNTARLGATIYNDSTAALYVKFGTTASATDFIVKLAAGAYYEVPQPVYTGRIDGIWAAANGNARITEL